MTTVGRGQGGPRVRGDMWMDAVWTWLAGTKATLALAGAAGGIVRWLTLREHPVQGLISMLVGCLCAIYLGPVGLSILTPVLGPIGIEDHDARVQLSGFLIGVGGITVSGFFIDLWNRRRQLLKGDQ